MFILTFIMGTGLAFQSCNSTDQKVKNEVDRVIGNHATVSASVNDKVVTLTGTVDSQQEKNAAENAARSVKDVRSVVNNITVRQSVMGMTVNSDQTLQSTIEARLNSEGYRDVRVSVNNGEVVLRGDVDRNDLSRVMQIANESNPRRVTNNLNLR